MYNLTNLTNSGTLVDVMVYVNNATYQVFTSFSMVCLYFILILALKAWQFDHAALVASWVSFLLSLLLTFAGLLNFLFPIGFLMITGFSALYVYMNKPKF